MHPAKTEPSNDKQTEVNMKMVKSLLLGTAAALAAVTAGQAADLPVKAKPVEYVKICSLYGAGFYYVPGTDFCLKLGGFLREEWNANAGGSFTTITSGANGLFTRNTDTLASRSRGVLTIDVRQETEYGTLRGYLSGGFQYTSNDSPSLSLPGVQVPAGGGAATAAAAPNLNGNVVVIRAFTQIAGFTVGKTSSFFDFFSTPKYTFQTNILWQEYGGVGVNTWAYTQQFGAGVSASIAIQDNTNFAHPVKDLNVAAGTAAGTGGAFLIFPIIGTGPTTGPWDNAGNLVPDIEANVRIDQTWGSAQLAGGLHDDRARNYTIGTGGPATVGSAHPADKWGYALSAGFDVNLPTAKGDTFAVQSQYCVGYSESCYQNSGTRDSDLAFGLTNGGGNRLGLGWVDDAYLANTAATGATSLQLPTVWNIVGAVQHYWVPNIRTSLYGAYAQYTANSSAVNTLVCAPGGLANGCADWATWQVGSRTIWNPVKSLDVGVEVLYTDLSKSAFNGAAVTFTPAGAAAQTYTIGSTHVVSGIARVQYNFVP